MEIVSPLRMRPLSGQVGGRGNVTQPATARCRELVSAERNRFPEVFKARRGRDGGQKMIYLLMDSASPAQSQAH
ncbi:hypothetical protein EYF80_005450 [Liparis tanakae]|uniref:Uncharacterized protein n=1 Tax=Liparis tanakae TaxID=230148 RepID=A0A4Z2J3N7_9TELE|nr:hypothetical protein EYF80_005450 [Liparis tanakae]